MSSGLPLRHFAFCRMIGSVTPDARVGLDLGDFRLAMSLNRAAPHRAASPDPKREQSQL